MNNSPGQCSNPPQIFLPWVVRSGLIFCSIYIYRNVFLLLRFSLLFQCITELLFIVVLDSHIQLSEKRSITTTKASLLESPTQAAKLYHVPAQNHTTQSARQDGVERQHSCWRKAGLWSRNLVFFYCPNTICAPASSHF